MERHITLPLTEELAKTFMQVIAFILQEPFTPPVMPDTRECARHLPEEKNFLLIRKMLRFIM